MCRKGKFNLPIGNVNFELFDLGAPMNESFKQFYKQAIAQNAFNFLAFRENAFNIFNSSDHRIQDKFFNNLTPLWSEYLQQDRNAIAERFWEYAIKLALEWERQNPDKRVHKGTPYYFWAVTCIESQKYEKGFLLMHRALAEDERTFKNNASGRPAHSFVSLNAANQNQFYLKKVKEASQFLALLLGNYNQKRNRNLEFQKISSEFLQKTSYPDMREIIFAFVYALFQLRFLNKEINADILDNDFASRIELETAFSLCLVVDKLIYHENPISWSTNKLLHALSQKAGLTLSDKEMVEINEKAKNDFENVIEQLLNEHKISGRSLTALECDIVICYIFRNTAAHDLRSYPVIRKRFKEISQSIINVLFLSLELLY